MRITLGVVLAAISSLSAQPPLSLTEAVRMGLTHHPAAEASHAAGQAAEIRIKQARSGFLPRLSYSESFQNSNNPVFVFSSLLTQHQFAAANFALGPLNRPSPVNNFQSQVTADQTVYDFGATRSGSFGGTE